MENEINIKLKKYYEDISLELKKQKEEAILIISVKSLFKIKSFCGYIVTKNKKIYHFSIIDNYIKKICIRNLEYVTLSNIQYFIIAKKVNSKILNKNIQGTQELDVLKKITAIKGDKYKEIIGCSNAYDYFNNLCSKLFKKLSVTKLHDISIENEEIERNNWEILEL